MTPKDGVQLSFVSDKISSGNLPTFFYPRLENPLSDEDFQRRVSEYGPPKKQNEKAAEIIRSIDPDDEVSVKEGLVKWILALTISDDNVFDFSKARNWISLRKCAESFSARHPWFGKLELSEPVNGGDYGFAEFNLCVDNDAVLQLSDDSLADFKDLISRSKGIILETARENGTVFANLVFSV